MVHSYLLFQCFVIVCAKLKKKKGGIYNVCTEFLI